VNLLNKIQDSLKKEPVSKNTGSPSNSIEELNKLPEPEKIKVLDYLKTIKTLPDES
jgi:hypothetical protein